MQKFLYSYNVTVLYTCFEQYYAHPQEVKLYVHIIWYHHSESKWVV